MMSKNKLIIYLIPIFVVSLIILTIHPYVLVGAYVCLFILSLASPKWAIQALSLNYIIILLNSSIYTLPEEIGVLRWYILFLAGLRVLPLATLRTLRYLIPLVLYYLMVTVLAWAVSPQFQISFLKISIFILFSLTILIAFDSMDNVTLNDLKIWFLSLTAAVLLLSLPTLFLPSIGFFHNGIGFQGILNHPQAFGLFIAPIAAYLVACMLLKKGCKNFWLWAFGAVAIVLLFFTRARTAMVTLLLAVGFVFAVNIVRLRQDAIDLAPSRFVLKISTIGIVFVALMVVSPVFSKSMASFLYKGDDKTVEEAFYHSRGQGIAFHWKRFLQRPLTGNGFGIDVAHGKELTPVTFLGIPVSAPTEKGFLPLAFLEEVGILGLALFVPFLLFLFRGAYGTQDIGLMAMFFACLLVNIGEAVFFSPGQIGGYLWLLIGLSTAARW